MAFYYYYYYYYYYFLDIAFRAGLRKGSLVLIKALLIFLFCFMRSWTETGTLVFDLVVFSGKLLWILMIESVKMMATLLMMPIGSGLSAKIRLRIWSCRIANCLERVELIESQSALWYSLTLIGSGIDLLMLVKKIK